MIDNQHPSLLRLNDLLPLPRIARLKPNPSTHRSRLHTDHLFPSSLRLEIPHALRALLPGVPDGAVRQSCAGDAEFGFGEFADGDGVVRVDGGVDAVGGGGEGEGVFEGGGA
jgi:hypothetical protein